MVLRAVADAVVGRDRWDCLDCDPVDLTSGQFVDEHLDLSVSDAVGSVALTRSYSSSVPGVGVFGVGGTHSYDLFITGSCAAGQPMMLNLPGAGRFASIGSGGARVVCT